MRDLYYLQIPSRTRFRNQDSQWPVECTVIPMVDWTATEETAVEMGILGGSPLNHQTGANAVDPTKFPSQVFLQQAVELSHSFERQSNGLQTDNLRYLTCHMSSHHRALFLQCCY